MTVLVLAVVLRDLSGPFVLEALYLTILLYSNHSAGPNENDLCPLSRLNIQTHASSTRSSQAVSHPAQTQSCPDTALKCELVLPT